MLPWLGGLSWQTPEPKGKTTDRFDVLHEEIQTKLMTAWAYVPDGPTKHTNKSHIDALCSDAFTLVQYAVLSHSPWVMQEIVRFQSQYDNRTFAKKQVWNGEWEPHPYLALPPEIHLLSALFGLLTNELIKVRDIVVYIHSDDAKRIVDAVASVLAPGDNRYKKAPDMDEMATHVVRSFSSGDDSSTIMRITSPRNMRIGIFDAAVGDCVKPDPPVYHGK